MEEFSEFNSAVVMALGAFLANYVPAVDVSSGVGLILKTTGMIERAIEDMAEPQPGEVAALMMQAGYSIVYMPDGRHGWAMNARQE